MKVFVSGKRIGENEVECFLEVMEVPREDKFRSVKPQTDIMFVGKTNDQRMLSITIDREEAGRILKEMAGILSKV